MKPVRGLKAYYYFLIGIILLGLTSTLTLYSLHITENFYNKSIKDNLVTISERFRNEILAGDFRNFSAKAEKIDFLKSFDIFDSSCHSELKGNISNKCLNKSSRSEFIVPLYYDKEQKILAKNIYYEYKLRPFGFAESSFTFVIIFLFGAGLSILFIVQWLYQKEIAKVAKSFVEKTQNSLDSISEAKVNQFIKSYPRHLGPILESFFYLHKRLIETNEEIQNKKLELKLHEVATQIVHDLRVPVSILKDYLSSDFIKFDQKNILRNVVERIEKISQSSLTIKNKYPSQDVLSPGDTLIKCVESCVREYQFLNQSLQLKVHYQINERNHLWNKSIETDLSRVIINLLENASDATKMRKESQVNIFLTFEQNSVFKLSFFDNGKGIPSDILPKLCQKGATFGKINGNGLGLYHAKKTVEAWGGEFNIESKVDVGTTVSLTVPETPVPDWFLSQLYVAAATEIVILDDDPMIHKIWLKKFEQFSLKNSVFAFTKQNDFSFWLSKNPDHPNRFYLFDHDLGSSSENGLDLLQRYTILERASLVTGRYDSFEVQNRVKNLKTKLLPKNWIANLPIILTDFETQKSRATVLIDDDDLIRSFWQKKARDKKIRLDCFISFPDFCNHMAHYNKQTPIYIDSQLKGQKGEDCAKHLFGLGFQNITITTGYDKSKFENMPWLKGVIGKTPPWS